MRKIDFLIREVRKRTNTLDKKAISNLEVCGYYNQIVQNIVNFMTRSGSNDNLLTDYYDLDLVYGQGEYDIPSIAQGLCSIDSVRPIRDGSLGQPLKKVNISDIGTSGAYSVLNGRLLLSGEALYPQVRVFFNKRVANLSPIVAHVDSKNVNLLTIKDVKEDDFWLEDDRITINGETYSIITKNGMVLTLDREPDADPNDEILLGEDASREVGLIDEVEPYLLRAVEKLIRHRRNSVKLGAASMMSEEEMDSIRELIMKPSTDAQFPVILDDDFLY